VDSNFFSILSLFLFIDLDFKKIFQKNSKFLKYFSNIFLYELRENFEFSKILKFLDNNNLVNLPWLPGAPTKEQAIEELRLYNLRLEADAIYYKNKEKKLNLMVKRYKIKKAKEEKKKAEEIERIKNEEKLKREEERKKYQLEFKKNQIEQKKAEEALKKKNESDNCNCEFINPFFLKKLTRWWNNNIIYLKKK